MTRTLTAALAVGVACALAALVIALPGASLAVASTRTAAGPSGQLAYVRSGHIWTANVDGSNRHRLTTGSAIDAQPTWSPNGRLIAFLRGPRDPKNGSPLEQVWVMDVNGKHAHRISFPIGLRQMPGTKHKDVIYFLEALAWLPSGSDLVVAAHAFSGYPDTAQGEDATQVFLVHPNGSAQRRIGRLIYGDAGRLSCRPDGKLIALSLYYRMGYSEIWTLNRASGHYSKSFPGQYVDYAAWSPDGRSMACERSDDQNYIMGPGHLASMNVKTHAITNLLAVDRGYQWPYLYASWAPKGAWLACAIGDHYGPRNIEIVFPASQTSHAILANADEPAWRPFVR